jgi:hypothetical protein
VASSVNFPAATTGISLGAITEAALEGTTEIFPVATIGVVSEEIVEISPVAITTPSRWEAAAPVQPFIPAPEAVSQVHTAKPADLIHALAV